jgi:hypothetical protein
MRNHKIQKLAINRFKLHNMIKRITTGVLAGMKQFLYILLFTCSAACMSTGTKKIDPRVLKLPSFKLLQLDSSRIFNTKDIATGMPTILVYFSPDCKFSRQQTENMLANYSSLQHIRFYMCSDVPLAKLNAFYRHYQLNRYTNIIVGKDYELFFDKELKVPSFPWLFIYAPDNRLKKIITGSTDAKTIIDMLNG